MARSLFGGRIGDSVVSLFALGRRQLLTLPIDANGDPTSTTLQVWDEPDGTQLTDLRAADGTTIITSVVVPVGGQIPEFFGPDGVNVAVYLLDPDGDYFRIDARIDDLAAAAVAAAAEATTAAADAAEAVADLIALSGTAGLALDTDGQPYFDPALAGTTPTLALLVDTDGAPYFVGA